jgi:hypothetical protein
MSFISAPFDFVGKTVKNTGKILGDVVEGTVTLNPGKVVKAPFEFTGGTIQETGRLPGRMLGCDSTNKRGNRRR